MLIYDKKFTWKVLKGECERGNKNQQAIISYN